MLCALCELNPEHIKEALQRDASTRSSGHLTLATIMTVINVSSSEVIETALALLKRHWLILTFTVVTAKVLQNRWLHPLSKFPGPFLGSVTYWYSVYIFFSYRAHELEYDLNKKYGRWALIDLQQLGCSLCKNTKVY